MADVVSIVGTRPQYIKAAMMNTVIAQWPEVLPFRHVIVNTGQHYDDVLSDVFFRELEGGEPDVHLSVGSGSHGAQTGRMLADIERVLMEREVDAVLAYGDTNTTLAAALAAVKLDIPVVHIEAGVRLSYRRQVPEEWNRILSDHAAALCFAVTRTDLQHLQREGITGDRAVFAGDILYDLFLRTSARSAATSAWPACLGLGPGSYHVATIHRAENTDHPSRLRTLIEALAASPQPVVWPVHPRTRNAMQAAGIEGGAGHIGNLRLIQPLGYADFQALLLACHRVVTDSGGVMRESYFAGKPCVVPRASTWFPEIVEAGWAQPTGDDLSTLARWIDTFEPPTQRPAIFGDGDAGVVMVRRLRQLIDDHRAATVDAEVSAHT